MSDGGKYQPKICPACQEDRHGERFIADLCPQCFRLGVPYPDEQQRQVVLDGVTIECDTAKEARQPIQSIADDTKKKTRVNESPRYSNRAKRYAIPSSRWSTRPRPRQEWRLREPKDKYGRYRTRLRLAGKCPHCGELCAPYYECERRRFYKRLKYHLDRSVHLGILYRTPAGEYGLTEWLKQEQAQDGGAKRGVGA